MQYTEQDFRRVAANSLFAGCDKDRLARILTEYDCRAVTYSDGALLHSPEDRDRWIGIMLSGKATVTKPTASRNSLLRFLGVGEMFGIANLFSDEPFVSIIRAHGECRVFLIPEAAIRHLLEQDSAFLYQYLGFLSSRIRYLNNKISYLTAGSAERKLALYLASYGKQTFRLDAPISALSELLDLGRASLYRAFDRLREDGFLQKDGRTFTLSDPERMLQAYQ